MSQFDKKIDRYNTYCTQWDYTKDRFGNEDVIPFSISDMDFEVPSSTKKVLQERLEHGIFGYTRWNHSDLHDAVVNWYQKRFDYQLNPNYITYSPTVIYSLAELLRIKCINKKVLVITPGYDGFWGVCSENNLELITSDLEVIDSKYQINHDDFKAKVKLCDVLLFCSPHNPVGKVYSQSELEFIVNCCKENDTFIISDEIHMDITFEKQHIPMLKVAQTLNYENNTCIITSASKSFNFPGLLFSYALIADHGLKSQFEVSLKQKNGLSSCTVLGLAATMDVYNNGDQWLDELNQYVYDNYQFVKNSFQAANLKLVINQFDATYLLWIDASYYQKNFEELKQVLYNKYKIGIMDGNVYKMDYHLRINIGCSRQKLELGVNGLIAAIKEIS